MEETPRKLAVHIAKLLDNKKASPVDVLHVAPLTSLTEYFVIAGGTSTTQVQALADEVEEKLKESGLSPSGIEGYRSAGWVLLNYDSVVVHIFTPEMRNFYQLEHLWGDAERLNAEEWMTE